MQMKNTLEAQTKSNEESPEDANQGTDVSPWLVILTQFLNKKMSMELIDLGYDSMEAVTSSVTGPDDLDEWVETVLTTNEWMGKFPADKWKTHPVAGKLRRLWAHCHEQSPFPWPKTPAPAQAQEAHQEPGGTPEAGYDEDNGDQPNTWDTDSPRTKRPRVEHQQGAGTTNTKEDESKTTGQGSNPPNPPSAQGSTQVMSPMGMTIQHPMQSFFPEGLPMKLDLASVTPLKESFLEFYPGEVLDRTTMPGRKLLEKVHHQTHPGNELRWLPWEQLMNQEQEEEAVRLKTKNRVPGSDWGMFMHLLWEDQMKSQDGQMSGAPFFISRLQTVRRNAYSMCADVHLQVWKKLDM